MSVSIIIPCFNAAATIGEAIASALAQRGPGGEILVVDDGSTDGSLAMARGFGPGVRVVTGPYRRGLGGAQPRHRGDRPANGWSFSTPMICCCAETLRQRLDTASATDADVVVCDWQELVDDGPIQC